MKTLYYKISLALLVGTCSAAAAQESAQSADELGNRLEFTRVSKDSLLREIIAKDAPVGPKEVGVPTFALRTKNNKFIMTIGGYVNPIVGTDFGNNLYKVDGAGIGFVTSRIPAVAQPGHKSDFYINPFQGALSFQVTGFGGTDNQVTAYFKIGTSGMEPQLNFLR